MTLFNRTLFESAGFILGILIGANVGFILAFMYLVMGGE